MLLGKSRAHGAADNGQHQHGGNSRHGLAAHGAGGLAVLFALFAHDRHDVHDAEHQRNEKNHNGRKGVDGRVHALGHRVDQNRNVVDAVARREVRDDEVVKAHRERNERAGDDTRLDLRHNDFRERLERRCAKVHRCVDQVRVERAELRRNGEHHVGDTEHDMRDEQRAEAFFDREDAEKHQK